jgi:penicillin-binding protein 2
LQPVEALARSCNIFFYELGTRLGFTNLISWLQRFGYSQPVASQMSRVETSGQQGHVPNEAYIQSLRDRGAIAFETVSISIGQGALTWSPLHAAAAYATLARGGIWIPPSLVSGLQHKSVDLQLNQEGVSLALLGLHDSVTQKYGTGAFLRYAAGDDEPTFNVDGIRIWGKTGTAQAPPYILNQQSEEISLNQQSEEISADHSWFLVMASSISETSPTVVVAVLVEHGGSGGRVAGPIANQILHAIQAEGYLEPRR